MIKFTVKFLKGFEFFKFPIFELIMNEKKTNGENQWPVFERFIHDINKKHYHYYPEFNGVFVRLHAISNGMILPRQKFKPIPIKSDKYMGFEIKTRNLRIYLIRHVNKGYLIVHAGIKSTAQQKKDINKFKGIVKQIEINGYEQIY